MAFTNEGHHFTAPDRGYVKRQCQHSREDMLALPQRVNGAPDAWALSAAWTPRFHRGQTPPR